MNLREALLYLIEEYPKAVKRPFTKDRIAKFIREDFPNILKTHIGKSDYTTKGSAGISKWTDVPWIAVFHPQVTNSAMRGFYIVYLFKEDLSGVYISLNQGITTIRDKYGKNAKHHLRECANTFARRLEKLPDMFSEGEIDLATKKTSSRSAFYEKGNICHRFYPCDAMPDEANLVQDLHHLLNAYASLVNEQPELSQSFRKKDVFNRSPVDELNDGATRIRNRGRRGDDTLPITRSFIRPATAAVECTPEHAQMQAKLLTDLHAEYPNACIVREENFIDVRVQTETELILFEIKSDPEPRIVIRNALGQILEYAFYLQREKTLPVRLIIVGQAPLTSTDEQYLE